MNDQNWVRKPIAPPAHIQYAHKLGRGMLTLEQIDELAKAINPAYVETKQRLTYLAQHQARAEMNRIFGYGNWDVHADDIELMYEYSEQGTGQKANTTYWLTAYRAKVTVEIRDLWGMPVASYTGVHAEENAKQPNRGEAHALALTSVDSYALRRALINLGDRFGLGLYDGGSTEAHGQYTIQQSPGQLFQWEQIGPVAPEPQAPQQAAPAPTTRGGPWTGTPDGQGEVRDARRHRRRAEGDEGRRDDQVLMDQFHQAQAAQQAERDQAKASMTERMQAQMKVDDDSHPDPDAGPENG